MLLKKVYNTKKYNRRKSIAKNLLWSVDSILFFCHLDGVVLYCDVRLLPETLMQLSSLFPPFWLSKEWDTEGQYTFQCFIQLLSRFHPNTFTLKMETFMVYILVEMFAKYKNAPYSVYTLFGNGFIFRFTRFPHDTHTTSAMWHVPRLKFEEKPKADEAVVKCHEIQQYLCSRLCDSRKVEYVRSCYCYIYGLKYGLHSHRLKPSPSLLIFMNI